MVFSFTHTELCNVSHFKISTGKQSPLKHFLTPHYCKSSGIHVLHTAPLWLSVFCLVHPHSVEHIVGNLIMQLVLGIPLELVHKGFEVGMVYMAGVLAGERPPSVFHVRMLALPCYKAAF